MFSNFAYLLTSKSITLYILYILHVMLGTSLVFTALYTYGVHSSKAMARAAALEASMQGSVNGVKIAGMRAPMNESAVEFEEDVDAMEMDGMEMAGRGLYDGRGMRRVKSMGGLRNGRMGLESANMGFAGKRNGKGAGVGFREVCYGGDGKRDVRFDMPVMGGKGGMTLGIS
ncbi:hypothetical protein NHQ30_011120 [Ciborinia camelliae]|nr:hypothetical protein NHQ30_011120 [Ciborinia camelliae]